MANIQKTVGRLNPKRLKPAVKKWSKRTKVVVGVIAALVVLYFVYAIILYTTGGSDDLTRFVSNFAYYPAAKLFAPGFWPYYLGGLLATVVLVGAFVRLACLLLCGRKPNRRSWAILVGLILIGALNLTWLPPVTSASVSYGSYLDRVATSEKIQASQEAQGVPAVPEGQLKSNSLNQLIQQVVIQQTAVKLGVSVPASEVEETYDAQAERVGGEKEFKRLLKERLGWSVREYKQELRDGSLTAETLNEKIASDDDINKEAKEKADKALQALKDGTSFAKVAEEYSDDPTAAKGGKQGKLQRGQLDPAIEEKAFSVEVGDTSDIIKAREGFVIIKVDSREGDTVELSKITIIGQNISSYFQEILPDAKVWILVDGLRWDDTLFIVQPTEQEEPQPQLTPQAGASGAPAGTAAPAATAQPGS